MKWAANGIGIILAIVIVTNCNHLYPGGNLQVTLQISMVDLCLKLSGNQNDEIFRTALKQASEKHGRAKTKFWSLFKNAYTNQTPNKAFVSVFANQAMLDQNASNKEVLGFLKSQTAKTLDQTVKILRKRVENAGVKESNFQTLPEKGQIKAQLKGFNDSSRIKKLLTIRGKLSFWETYEAKTVIPHFDTVNEVLRESAKKTNGNSAKNRQATSGKNDPSDNKQLSKEEFKRKYPLYNKLRPAANSDGSIYKGPTIGYAKSHDTAKVIAYLTRPSVQKVLPGDLRFIWSHKPTLDTNAILRLYGIRITTETGEAPLTGKAIQEAHAKISQNENYQITIKMNEKGAETWQTLTRNNIGNSIAIVMDGKVLSAPKVSQEIAKGRSVISGRFSKEEALNLANVIGVSGILPVKVSIASKM